MADIFHLLQHIMWIAGLINLCLLDDEFLAVTLAGGPLLGNGKMSGARASQSSFCTIDSTGLCFTCSFGEKFACRE